MIKPTRDQFIIITMKHLAETDEPAKDVLRRVNAMADEMPAGHFAEADDRRSEEAFEKGRKQIEDEQKKEAREDSKDARDDGGK